MTASIQHFFVIPPPSSWTQKPRGKHTSAVSGRGGAVAAAPDGVTLGSNRMGPCSRCRRVSTHSNVPATTGVLRRH